MGRQSQRRQSWLTSYDQWPMASDHPPRPEFAATTMQQARLKPAGSCGWAKAPMRTLRSGTWFSQANPHSTASIRDEDKAFFVTAVRHGHQQPAKDLMTPSPDPGRGPCTKPCYQATQDNSIFRRHDVDTTAANQRRLRAARQSVLKPFAAMCPGADV